MGGLLKRLHGLGARTVVITDDPQEHSPRMNGPLLRGLLPRPCPADRPHGRRRRLHRDADAALCKGYPLDEALAWAPINAMSVVHQVGSQAGLLSEQEVKQWLDQAPTGYSVSTW